MNKQLKEDLTVFSTNWKKLSTLERVGAVGFMVVLAVILTLAFTSIIIGLA